MFIDRRSLSLPTPFGGAEFNWFVPLKFIPLHRTALNGNSDARFL